MKKILLVFALLLACYAGALATRFAASAHAAEAAPTRDEAVAMVRQVIAALKAQGREKTIAEVNDPRSRFNARDLSVAIGSMDGRGVANAANPRAVGRNVKSLKDADGKLFIRQRNELLEKQPSVWVDFVQRNVAMQRNEPLAMYAERWEDLVVSAIVARR